MSQIYIKPKIVEIFHPVIMFKLAKSYSPDIKDLQLYTVTRGQWKMDVNKAKNFKYAFACDAGLVVEVYEIESWHLCNQTMTVEEIEYRKANKLFDQHKDRIEFVGKQLAFCA